MRLSNTSKSNANHQQSRHSADQERRIALFESAQILAQVRDHVISCIVPGVSFEELESIAQNDLKRLGASPSFTTVEDYQWATCITKNEGCCHGIPRGKKVDDGDIITIDVGALYKGYHSDTAVTVCAGTCAPKVHEFLSVGKKALEVAIQQAVPGNTVYDISYAMQAEVESHGYRSVYQLTGHGIGKVLHLNPNIPCYADERSKKDVLFEGQSIAIEVMYAMGNPTLVLGKDGWTYETRDKSLTGMFEHTVLLTNSGPKILTIQDSSLREKLFS